MHTINDGLEKGNFDFRGTSIQLSSPKDENISLNQIKHCFAMKNHHYEPFMQKYFYKVFFNKLNVSPINK